MSELIFSDLGNCPYNEDDWCKNAKCDHNACVGTSRCDYYRKVVKAEIWLGRHDDEDGDDEEENDIGGGYYDGFD